MSDQAEKLRSLVRSGRGHAVVISGPKGGIGRTTLAVNLAAALAEDGQKVCLVDTDLNFPNVTLLLGERPLYSLGHVWQGKCAALEALHMSSLGFPLLAHRGSELVDFSAKDMAELLGRLEPLREEFDFLVLDSAATAKGSVEALWSWCEEVLLVTTPEPPSLVGMYTLLRRLKAKREVSLLVNRAQSLRQERDIAEIIVRAAEEMADLSVFVYGGIPEDARLLDAYLQRQLVLRQHPRSGASKAIYRLARQLVKRRESSPKGFSVFQKVV